ncbi:MAG: SRPBCC family protein [Flavobacteriales bacterium]|nr:SRPBCC family protein [Flavobacteriales bacterium]
MKILKIILGIVVVVAGLFCAYLATLPSTYKVEKSVVINASPDLIMQQLADFKEWGNWSPWKAKDPAAAYTYEGEPMAVGSKMSWVSSLPADDQNQIGSGGMEITEVNGNESMNYTLTFVKPWEMSSWGGFALLQEEGGTKVTWKDEGELGFFMRPMGSMMDAMIGPDFVKGLDNLKTYVEGKAAELAAKPSYNVEEIAVESFYYIAVQDTCVVADIGPKFGEVMGKVMTYTKTNSIEPAGYPFAIYHSWDGVGTRFTAGVPVAKAIKGKGEVKGGSSYAGNALKVRFTGPYEQTEKVHEAIGIYAEMNGKEMVGAPWEVYVTDPMSEPDSTKWITEIYYPVK